MSGIHNRFNILDAMKLRIVIGVLLSGVLVIGIQAQDQITDFRSNHLPVPRWQSIGIGVLRLTHFHRLLNDSVHERTILFYSTADAVEPVYRVEGFDTFQNPETTRDSSWLLPLMALHGRVFLRCTDSTATRYRVVVNERSGTQLWVGTDTRIAYGEQYTSVMSWKEYVGGNTISLNRNNDLRSAPSMTAPPLPLPANWCSRYQADSMWNEWIHVRSQNSECELRDGKRTAYNEGWVRWTDGRRLLFYAVFME